MSTRVDSDQMYRIKTKKWNCNMDSHSGNYYVTTQLRIERDGKVIYRKLGLAEFLMGERPEGMEIDHINGISTDNRLCNLRFCTHAQNLMNRSKRKNTDCKYKGVVKAYNGFKAQIVSGGKNYHLGTFKTQEDAAIAYNVAATKHFGEYARLNKVKGM